MGTLEVEEVLRRLGGTATTAQLLARVTRRALESAVAAGQVRRLRRGCYGLPELPPARRAAALPCGAASHLSAAQVWGMEALLPATRTWVAVRPNAHPPHLRGVRVGWAPVSTEELSAHVTAPLRTVLDCAAALPFPEALAVADSALRRELVGPEELVAAAAARRGPGDAAVRRVARWADARTANPFESGLRAVVLDAGQTGFEPQAPVRVSTGWIRVDLADEALRLLLEADSLAWHGSRTALERDCRRYDEAVRAGWVVLRVAWEHVMFDQEWLGALVTDVAAQQRADREEEKPRRGPGGRP